MILYSTRRVDGVIAPVAKTAPTSPRHATSSRPPPHRFNAIPVRNFVKYARSRHPGPGRWGEGRQKNRKKMQKFAVGHKCPNYLVAGIRSTRRLYGRRHRNLSGRRNLRDGRANERPRHPLFVPMSPPRCPNSHSDAPNYPSSRPPPPAPANLLPLPFVALCRPNQFRSPRFSWADSWRVTVRWKILYGSPSSFEKIFDYDNKLLSLINQD